ncbi:MAG: HEAT repeat domain-containing protein [Deltaproteobacteria bacterium]|nr:HEAT repeat domain-containing protein [Deltaproteobacteria bacterium]
MLVGRFQGRDIIDKPACPFCGSLLERPGERPRGEMPLGRCSCGAVFACDVTGHNLGTAMSEALVAACGGNWDAAWDLLPEEDYLEKQVQHYDPETHLIIYGGVHQGRRIAGTLLFIRLQKQLCLPQNEKEVFSRTPPPAARGKKSFSKKEVEALVAAYDLEPLLCAAAEDKRILRDLRRLLYSADPLLLRRAAEALGKVSSVIARSDPESITKLLQGLFSSVTDTAASSWGALDAIGEILACQPDLFSGFLPQLIHLSRTPSILEGVLRALGRIAESRADLLESLCPRILPFLMHPEPAVRGTAAQILGTLRAVAARETLEKLRDDEAEMNVYRQGGLQPTTVGRLAAEALSRI